MKKLLFSSLIFIFVMCSFAFADADEKGTKVDDLKFNDRIYTVEQADNEFTKLIFAETNLTVSHSSSIEFPGIAKVVRNGNMVTLTISGGTFGGDYRGNRYLTNPDPTNDMFNYTSYSYDASSGAFNNYNLANYWHITGSSLRTSLLNTAIPVGFRPKTTVGQIGKININRQWWVQDLFIEHYRASRQCYFEISPSGNITLERFPIFSGLPTHPYIVANTTIIKSDMLTNTGNLSTYFQLPIWCDLEEKSGNKYPEIFYVNFTCTYETEDPAPINSAQIINPPYDVQDNRLVQISSSTNLPMTGTNLKWQESGSPFYGCRTAFPGVAQVSRQGNFVSLDIEYDPNITMADIKGPSPYSIIPFLTNHWFIRGAYPINNPNIEVVEIGGNATPTDTKIVSSPTYKVGFELPQIPDGYKPKYQTIAFSKIRLTPTGATWWTQTGSYSDATINNRMCYAKISTAGDIDLDTTLAAYTGNGGEVIGTMLWNTQTLTKNWALFAISLHAVYETADTPPDGSVIIIDDSN